MEAKPVGQCDAIIVNHRECGHLSQVIGEGDWDLSDPVVADVDNFELSELRPTELFDVSEVIHVQVQLLKGWQVFANTGNFLESIPIETQVAQVL